MTISPKACAGSVERVPPKLPTGVRTADVMTMSVMKGSFAQGANIGAKRKLSRDAFGVLRRQGAAPANE